MNFILTGVSHNNAPLDILERVAVSDEELPLRIRDLSERLDARDSATILSTCNRTELYAVTRNPGAAIEEMVAYLSFLGTRRAPSHSKSIETDLTPYIYSKTGYGAVQHIFRVVTGLDSLVQGDHQVAGQVSRSFQALSSVDKPADPALSRLYHVAFRTGRKARRESGLGWSQVSIPSFGVKLLEREVGDLHDKSALLVGAGDTGRITAQSLMRAGIADMRIASRSRERAEGLAQDMDAVAVNMEDVPHQMDTVNIVITCTGADHNIILKRDVESAIKTRSSDLHILDLGLPRDLEPAIGELKHVKLYTLTDLEQLQAEHQKSIAIASQKAEAIVAEATADFIDDVQIQPLLRHIGASAEKIRATELQRTMSKLDHLDASTRDAIDAMTRSMVKRILADPIQIIKDRKR